VRERRRCQRVRVTQVSCLTRRADILSARSAGWKPALLPLLIVVLLPRIVF
jgi:hypothetical protein